MVNAINITIIIIDQPQTGLHDGTQSSWLILRISDAPKKARPRLRAAFASFCMQDGSGR